MKFLKNKKILLVIVISVLILSLITTFISAYLLFNSNIDASLIVGNVEVEVFAYFQREDSTDPNDYLIVDMSTAEGGVVSINITDSNELEHFNNFKVKIKIYSSVNTYFRVAIYEQFTLTYVVGDTTTVIATTRDEFSPFNFNQYYGDGRLNDNGKFYDNRTQDGYFYYLDQVKRVDENTPLELDFIKESLVDHDIYPARYSLQIGFIIEAVQYYLGPEKNWGLENPPWPNNSGW